MLRTYETIYVTNPDVSQETFDAIDGKLKGFISSAGGEICHEEVWGVRNLAFPIKKKDKGRYSYLLYTARPDAIKDIEFYLKITEPVLTFLTVKLKETADLENVVKPNVKDLN
jgi:small subunit ribosomal protein S6